MIGKPVNSVLMLGVGAIGTYIGGSLALAGCNVVFVERPEIAEQVRRRGLKIRLGDEERIVTDVQVVSTISEALDIQNYDAALVAVKSFDTPSVIESIRPFEQRFPPVLSLQNGVENEGVIGSLLGGRRVIAGTVTTSVERGDAGEIVVQKLRGVGIAQTHALSEGLLDVMNRAGLRAVGYAHPHGMKWSKMLTNLLANASSAVLNMPPAAIFAHAGLYRVELAMIREALAVMAALNYPVTDLPATPVRLLVNLMRKLPANLSQPLLVQALGKGRGAKMPSFHIDLHSGRGKSEVDYLNGAISRFGRKVGVDTPVNDWLTRMLTALTAGTLPMSVLAGKPGDFLGWLGEGRTSL